MRIILADDQPKVRSALRLLLEQQPWAACILEAASAGELLEQLKDHGPTLVLLDWELPGASSDEILRSIRSLCPAIKIIAMSVDLDAARAALHAGADAFVSKGDPPSTLLATLSALLVNEGAISKEISSGDKTTPIE